MNQKDTNFLKKLFSIFKIEAQEHLRIISSGLLALEKTLAPEKQMEIIETIFREAHSLKGAARSVNIMEIEAICQSMESVLAGLKRKEIASSPALFDVFHRAIDSLDKLLTSPSIERTTDEKSKIAALIRQLKSVLQSTPPSPQREEQRKTESKEPLEAERAVLTTGENQSVDGYGSPDTPESKKPFLSEKPLRTEMVRISTAKLDVLLLQVEEMLSVKLKINQLTTDLRDINTLFDPWKKEWSKVQPEVRKVRQLLKRKNKQNQVRSGDPSIPFDPAQDLGYYVNHLLVATDVTLAKATTSHKLLEFLNWSHTYIKSLESKLITLAKSAEYNNRSLGGMVD
ncbi:MAG: Hpt domain-containing protein, partial [Nitrospira sp.]|nr:Hpt domain-containing protein [Nitrospira sp.]